MAQTEKSGQEPSVAFDLNASVNDAIGACGGDLLATIRSLLVANNFLMAQNQILSTAGLRLEVGLAWLLSIDQQTADENRRGVMDTTQMRGKMMEHLEAALALADQTGDAMARYRIEQAIDELVTAAVAALDPRTDIKRP